MITLHDHGVFFANGVPCADAPISPAEGRRQTMAWSILQAHNAGDDPENLKIKFDAMASHDITFVGIIQTARASGLEKFPVPEVAVSSCLW